MAVKNPLSDVFSIIRNLLVASHGTYLHSKIGDYDKLQNQTLHTII